jgi:hypothetical protein
MFAKNGLGHILVNFFRKLIWSPCSEALFDIKFRRTNFSRIFRNRNGSVADDSLCSRLIITSLGKLRVAPY